MKTVSILIFCLLTNLMFSCEDVVDINLKEGSNAIVVDGHITTEDKPISIKLSKTGPYFYNTNTPKVRGALVWVTDNEGQTDTLKEVYPGEYATMYNRKGREGNTYNLYIEAEGEKYTATTEIKRVPVIDSLTLEYVKEKNSQKGGYKLLYHGPEPEGQGDFYKFRITRNDTVLNDPSDAWNIASDEWVDGNYIRNFEVHGNTLQKGDKVRVEIISLSKDEYLFLNEMATQINNGGMFANPPANIRTNVKNTDPQSKKMAVGYFGGHGINYLEKIVLVE